MISPLAVYETLLGRFGPQGWWPLTPPGQLRPRYHPGRFGPARERQALEVCVGAILTQNTAWSNVEKALIRLNSAKAVDLDRLTRLPRRRLGQLIRPSGYFTQKAIKLKNFAAHVQGLDSSLARWLRGPLPSLRRELLSVKGVGPETADSILLYAGARPVFVVDAYTRRIGERLGWLEPAMGYDQVGRFITDRLPGRPGVYQEFHALLVALAKFSCRKEPLCLGCPLLAHCPSGRRRRFAKAGARASA